MLSGKPLSQLIVIMPINANINAGTTVMQYEGFAYAMCSTGPVYKNIVVHEAGGHGFAKLGDEYAYNEMVVPPYRVTPFLNGSQPEYARHHPNLVERLCR